MMNALATEKCADTFPDTPPATPADITALSRQTPDWRIIPGDDNIPRLWKTFRFRDFNGAIQFSVRLGSISDGEMHHPRLLVEWGHVGVEWWTHKIGALHRNDFIMASKTDALYAQISAE